MPLLARTEPSFHVPHLQCPGNVVAELTGWQPPVDAVSPAIFTFRCNSPTTAGSITTLTTTTSTHAPFITTPPSTPFIGSMLGKRQAPPPNICPAQCSTSCYTSGIQYNSDDCSNLSNQLFQRGAQFEVRPHERVVMTWGSCMYAFTNDRPGPVTWCDTQWAQIGLDIASPCQSPNTGGGGQCAGDGFRVEVLSNDGSTDTPVPYSSTITASITSSTTLANITTQSGSITTTSSSTPMATAEIYTQVPIPPMTTVSSILPSDNMTLSATNDDSNTKLPMVPLLVGTIGGLLFLIFVIIAFVMVWRRARRGPRLRLPSEDGHAPRAGSSYNLKLTKMPPSQESFFNQSQPQTSNHRVQFQRRNTDDQNLQVPGAAPKDDSSQETSSRVPTALSVYTMDFDPFRALRRNRSVTDNSRNAT